MVNLSGMYIIQLKNSANYAIESEYTFYLLAKVQSVAEKWVSSQSSEQFKLTVKGCQSYLSINTASIPSIVTGSSGSSISVIQSASSYIYSSDTTNCPLNYFSITVSEGSPTNLNIG